jgi:ubiquinone/menaquinone biosynthesis C-methylase UbiE
MQEEVRNCFDNLAHSYAHSYSDGSRVSHFFKVRKRLVEELLAGAPTESKVLEVGCGPGMMVDYFLQRKADYNGVDLSSKMIAECKAKFNGQASPRFSVGDVQQLNFPDSYFDIVLCLGVLEYVPAESQAIREMARVLKPGGTLVLSAITKWSPFNAWDRLVYRKLARLDSGPIVQEYHTEEHYRKLLPAFGLNIVDVLYFDFSLVVHPLDYKLPKISLALSERLECFRQSMLRKLGNGFLVKCRASKEGKI